MSRAGLGLKFNPFEPAASGAPLGNKLWLPDSWKIRLQNRLNRLSEAQGVKAIALVGEYGSGKTYILQWLYRQELPKRRIEPFYFNNPGVQFSELANGLLRQIGRKDFAKYLWELAGSHVTSQPSLFAKGYEEYISEGPRTLSEMLGSLQHGIVKTGITSDSSIAYALAQFIAETPQKNSQDYRDFVAQSVMVAEPEAAPYFDAILKTIQLGAGINAVAFAIDEFQEISLQKQLTRRETHDYLATLKRLTNLTTRSNFWLILGMTPQALLTTRQLEPELWARLTADGEYEFEVPPLTPTEAVELVKHRLARARTGQVSNSLFPFPGAFENILSPATIANPRRLVKICSSAISNAEDAPLPFSPEYLQSIESKAYPVSVVGR